ncbi:hypothetical protein FHS16_005922 [Paenibacillus endophyticus]|uniref:Uncharacterized protein n=1 Tax=Paenibacillus endophyticus TaxID=1294268 RepID=A0A7W5CDQ9_9BACL|nr:hypothetical protein [Paenibacillus endophyticus]
MMFRKLYDHPVTVACDELPIWELYPLLRGGGMAEK